MSNQRNSADLILRTKLLLPEAVWRTMTKPASALLRLVPEKTKYRSGVKRRAGRLPYSIIEPDDIVVQIGAPRDLLAVGRSRAAYFLNLISGTGKLVVIEPDPKNCDALAAYAARNGLSDKLIIANVGGWSSEKELAFYESPDHPASAVLVELCDATPQQMQRRGYTEVRIPVNTVDNLIEKHGLPVPKLVSITTNGAELEILEGMKKTLETGPEYISLAITGDRYDEAMRKLNYRHLSDDDRGFTFKRDRQ